MPSDRTMVTELGTALGMLGADSVEDALSIRPAVMRSLSPETWDHLARLRTGGAFDAEFHAAWSNGRAFLAAREGLRGRQPELVEWKGTGRAPGDDVAPIDLRVDHVYLVSCKYLSKILFNTSPAHVFDALLSGRPRPDSGEAGAGDWYAQVAPRAYQELYEVVRAAALEESTSSASSLSAPPSESPQLDRGTTRQTSPTPTLPGLDGRGGHAPQSPCLAGAPKSQPAGPLGRRVGGVPWTATSVAPDQLPRLAVDLTTTQREALGRWLRAGWPASAEERYRGLSGAVAEVSARRWRAALSGGAAEAMVWRLLRIGNAPYFVLGSARGRTLRLRIDTPWDWRQHFRLVELEVEAQAGGQPRVGWQASVQNRASHDVHHVAGHIEVRWSHGRFAGPPEAKGYLDTPHHLVPGYVTLR